jgi:predicted dehydrogenase
MSQQVKVALVGIGGYGDSYLTALLQKHAQNDPAISLVGVVDPMPQRCRRLDEVRSARVRIHSDLPSLYAESKPDLLMMATPIHLHAPHTCWALDQGSNVLCEKPLAATVRDARRIAAAEKLADRFVAIGYQWSFSNAIQQLKQDVRAGLFGKPLRLKSIVLFPRGIDYFSRNDWAGKIKTSSGEPVFDSPANNAAAHYLHNMFYLLGSSRQTSAMPLTVQAELYRANEIENYDTAVMRVKVDCGAELLFYTSHTIPPRLGPIARYEFEDAVISYEAESSVGFIARFRNGRVKRYGEPNLERSQKMWQSVEAARSGEPVACGPSASMAHVLCIAAAQASMPSIRAFPQSLITREQAGDSEMVCVTGLHDALVQCYDQGILPSEHGGLEWSNRAEVIQVNDGLTASEQSTDGDDAHVVTGGSNGNSMRESIARAGTTPNPASAQTLIDRRGGRMSV